MKKITLIFAFLIFLSCGKTKPFFEFDEVEHYQVNSKNTVWQLLMVKQADWTQQGKEFHKILMEYDHPKTVSDTAFLKSLRTIYPKIDKININQFARLSEIFSEQKSLPNEPNACDPFFRDILVFRKENKVVGVAKICFECSQKYIVGTDANTENFGANGEFEKLEKLIK